MGNGSGFAAGAGDGRGAGVGLESFSIGEAGPVVAGLGEHPGAGERAEPWEAGDDPGVRVLVKRLDGGGLEVVRAGAGGVELAEQGERLAAHGLLDKGRLAHLPGAECLAQPLRPGVDSAAAPAFLSKARSWAGVSFAASPGVGAAARMARASGRVMPPLAAAKAARKPG